MALGTSWTLGGVVETFDLQQLLMVFQNLNILLIGGANLHLLMRLLLNQLSEGPLLVLIDLIYKVQAELIVLLR